MKRMKDICCRCQAERGSKFPEFAWSLGMKSCLPNDTPTSRYDVPEECNYILEIELCRENYSRWKRFTFWLAKRYQNYMKSRAIRKKMKSLLKEVWKQYREGKRIARLDVGEDVDRDWDVAYLKHHLIDMSVRPFGKNGIIVKFFEERKED